MYYDLPSWVYMFVYRLNMYTNVYTNMYLNMYTFQSAKIHKISIVVAVHQHDTETVSKNSYIMCMQTLPASWYVKMTGPKTLAGPAHSTCRFGSSAFTDPRR